ncbi:MAG: valine--pyruvate transaminase [Kiritimatiellia bacterium]|nr:valine--pyruvate transaminase [Kiritimatiellia bacterium]MDP6809449.1 valine--pyruvate transaminase [Kiritimatiellia bacterium]MDP7023874.1 valine--pyruvate transaminase [Kiritimatiellia bacterium]
MWSEFGKRMASHSGIGELMDDLGRAMAGQADMLMLGGGNPAGIPAVQEVWRQDMAALLEDADRFDRIMCHYDTPQGNTRFLAAVAKLFRDQYGWEIGPENVAVTNSSQNAYFMLLNMLAGQCEDGSQKKILLPVAPEYIGYADQGLSDDMFVACKPVITEIGDHEFKYHVDFDNLVIGDDIGAVCVSRPTNPTGNVLTDEEVQRLAAMTKERGIPLLIDSAYGAPFPNIIFGDVTPFWDEHVILTLSLSKLGLPGTRTGVVIASEEVIKAVASANAIISLASGNIGQALVVSHMESGRILKLSREIVRPFYEKRLHQALGWVDESFDKSLPWRLHTCEGALFLWLWCRDMPIDSCEFYERLKKRGVLVVPGHYFFYGLGDDWPHRHECIRINYSQPEATVREGLRIIAEEMRTVYG